MTTTASNVYVMDTADFAQAVGSMTTDLAAHDGNNRFKVGIYSSQGQTFGDDDGINGFRVFTASLDPNDAYYVGKVLNTDPDRFAEEQHLLYWDYSVEDELATVGTTAGSIALVSGSGASVSGAGATVTESPVWIPIGSIFSMEQIIMALSLLSLTTSISNSFHPSNDSSIWT